MRTRWTKLLDRRAVIICILWQPQAVFRKIYVLFHRKADVVLTGSELLSGRVRQVALAHIAAVGVKEAHSDDFVGDGFGRRSSLPSFVALTHRARQKLRDGTERDLERPNRACMLCLNGE